MDAAPARKLHSRVSLGTRLVFLIAGLGMSSWAPLVPFASERLALNGASLGALLLCLGIGSLAAMPVTGALVGRFGCRRVMFGSTLVILAMLPLLATVEVMWMMAAALIVFGAGLGMLDVAMNVQAVEVEKAAGKPMMSGFHGFFSLGGILGAGAISLLLGAGLSPLASVALVLLLMALLLAASLPTLMRERLHQPDQPWLVVPRGFVAFLGLLCFILFLAEGAVLDWGALLLLQRPAMSTAHAGLGYAVFSVAMTIGRPGAGGFSALAADGAARFPASGLRFIQYGADVIQCCRESTGYALESGDFRHDNAGICGYSLRSGLNRIYFSMAEPQRCLSAHRAAAAGCGRQCPTGCAMISGA